MNTMSSPKISIIVPSFNQGAYIEHTILSVLKQRYSNWELLIQDACSSDQTEEVCRTYTERDKRIFFFREKDKGFADGVNKALDRATGDICGIQSSDDFYSNPDVFDEVVALFKENPSLHLLAGYHLAIDKDLKEVLCPPPTQAEENGFLDRRNVFSLKNHFPQGSTFFSLARAIHVKKLNMHVDMVADTDFWIRLTNYVPANEKGILRVPKVWSCAIMHEEQRSVDQCKFSLGRTKMYRYMLEDSNIDLPKEEKQKVFRANIVDAFDYYNSQGKDTSELKGIWKEVFGEEISMKWKIKERLIRIPAFRNWLYRNIRERSTLHLLSYPRGKSMKWFE